MKRILAVFLVVLIAVLSISCKQEEPSVPTVSAPSSSVPVINDKPSSPTPSKEQGSSSNISSTQVSRPEVQPQPEQPIEPTPEPQPSEHEGHYCYSFLSDIQKVYYDVLHTAVDDMQTSWIVLGPKSENYGADVAVARDAVASDHPEIFWLPPYYMTAVGKDADGNPVTLMMFSNSAEISPAYLVSRGEKAYMEEELKSAAEEITSQVTSDDPFEIELQLHDLLCKRVEYIEDKGDPMIYTAYGALVNGKALCEGYARAMQLLLLSFGIETTTVTGMTEDEGHMWNAVKINEKWYNLDVTWDDTSKDFISYEYFNITDAEIALDHTIAKDYTEVFLKGDTQGELFNIAKPDCSATDDGYFTRLGFVFTLNNTTELAHYIMATNSDAVEIKFLDETVKEEFSKNYNKYIGELNQEFILSDPEYTYYIERISISSLCLKLYKAPTPPHRFPFV